MTAAWRGCCRSKIAPAFYEISEQVGFTLRRLLAGRIVGMVFEGVFTWLMLAIGGVPMAALLGLITGLLAFIPNIGAIMSGVLMVAVGFSAGTGEGLWAIFVYFFVQNVDGYLVVPYIARRTVDLAPGAGAGGAAAVRRLVRGVGSAAGRPDRGDDQGQRCRRSVPVGQGQPNVAPAAGEEGARKA